MSKNYFSYKSGHEASDIYIKNQPNWFDSDMLTSHVVGFIFGVFSTVIFILL
jgi:hypothetical protein